MSWRASFHGGVAFRKNNNNLTPATVILCRFWTRKGAKKSLPASVYHLGTTNCQNILGRHNKSNNVPNTKQ